MSLKKSVKNRLKITKNDLINVIKLIESYIFRRLICELPTSSLSKTFASLYKSLNPEDIVTSLEAQLLLMDAGKRFPDIQGRQPQAR